MPPLSSLKILLGYDYDEKKLNAAIVRNITGEKGSGTILLFESGSIVIVGVRCICKVIILGSTLVEQLNDLGLDCKLTDVEQRNIVVKAILDNNLVKRLWGVVDSGGTSGLYDTCCE